MGILTILFLSGLIIGIGFTYTMQELRWRLKKKSEKLWDDPQCDATDFAHPAFFRGEAWSCDMFCKLINKILDGATPSGMMNEPLQSVRQKAYKTVQTKNSYQTTIGKCFKILNEYKPNIAGGADLVDKVKELCEKLNAHTKYEGGASAECGHPVQCLYACAVVDGGPVRCFVCDMEEEIKRLKAYTRYVKNCVDKPKEYRSWWIHDYKRKQNGN